MTTAGHLTVLGRRISVESGFKATVISRRNGWPAVLAVMSRRDLIWSAGISWAMLNAICMIFSKDHFAREQRFDAEWLAARTWRLRSIGGAIWCKAAWEPRH
jgi:hypothetical protein